LRGLRDAPQIFIILSITTTDNRVFVINTQIQKGTSQALEHYAIMGYVRKSEIEGIGV